MNACMHTLQQYFTSGPDLHPSGQVALGSSSGSGSGSGSGLRSVLQIVPALKRVQFFTSHLPRGISVDVTAHPPSCPKQTKTLFCVFLWFRVAEPGRFCKLVNREPEDFYRSTCILTNRVLVQVCGSSPLSLPTWF